MLSLKRGPALFATAALFLVGSAGCNRDATSSNSGGGTVSSLSNSDAVATVNDTPITQADFLTALQSYVPNPQNPLSAGQPAGRAVLQQLIQNQLVLGLAKQEGVAPTDDEVNNQYANVKMVQEVRLVKSFEDALTDLGYTPDQFKSLQLRPQLAQYKLLTKGLTATDAEVKAYYDKHKDDQFTKPNRAHIKRIALASQNDAQAIATQIKGGKAFEAFISQSITRQPSDGDLPQWVNLDDTKNPALNPLIKTIKSTKAGDTTTPFPFQGGWWLVKVVETKPKEVWPFDQVKAFISYQLLNQKAQQDPSRFTTMQQKLRDYQTKAKYNVPEKQYADMVTELQNPPPPQPTFMSPPPGGAPGSAPRPGAAPQIRMVPSPAPQGGAKP